MKKVVYKQNQKSKSVVQEPKRKYGKRVVIKEPFTEAVTRLLRVKPQKKH